MSRSAAIMPRSLPDLGWNRVDVQNGTCFIIIFQSPQTRINLLFYLLYILFVTVFPSPSSAHHQTFLLLLDRRKREIHGVAPFSAKSSSTNCSYLTSYLQSSNYGKCHCFSGKEEKSLSQPARDPSDPYIGGNCEGDSLRNCLPRTVGFFREK